MKRMSTDEIRSHIPDRFSDDELRYIDEVALGHSRYLFYWTEKKRRHAWCSECNTERIVPKDFSHGDSVACGRCGKRLMAFRASRKRPYDHSYATIARKSPINPDVLVFMGIYAVRNYQNSFKERYENVSLVTVNVFEAGCSSTTLCGWFGNRAQLKVGEENTWRQGCTSGRSGAFRCPEYLHVDSIEAAVAGSPFRYMPWKQYVRLESEIVRFFSLAARYPSIEYLSKLGFRSLVHDAMFGGNHGAVRLSGTTIDQVLGVPKQSIKALRDLFVSTHMDSSDLLIWKMANAEKWDISAKELSRTESLYSSNAAIFKYLTKRVTLRRLLAYLDKQKRSMPPPDNSDRHVMSFWRDYLDACEKLNMDTTRASILCPTHLAKAHDRAIERVRYVADKALNDKIDARLPDLEKKYRFEADGFLIRPAQSSVELIREGNALHHCVGGYANMYAAGQTDILLIRRKTDMTTPFFTLEVIRGSISQCRGNRNTLPPPDVKQFVEKWKTKKLRRKKAESRHEMVHVAI